MPASPRVRVPALALAALLALGACGSPTRTGNSAESFSGTVEDAPDATPAEHQVFVGEAGLLSARLDWDDVAPNQPTGRAELRLSLLDPSGRTLGDTLGTPGGSPLGFTTRVEPGRYTLVVSPRFRDRIAFYCLCTVPYRLEVRYP